MKKINVAWLSQKYEGRQPHAAGTMSFIRDAGFNLHLVFLVARTDDVKPVEQYGFTPEFLSTNGGTTGLRPRLLFKLVQFLRKNDIHILHCNRHKCAIYGIPAARIAGVPVVFSHVHGIVNNVNWFGRLADRILLNRANRILFVSEAVQDHFVQTHPFISRTKLFMLHNSIDYEKFSNPGVSKSEARKMLSIPSNAFVFGTVGRLVPVKGQSFMIDAFASVHKTHPDSILVFIGDGRLRSDLESQARRLGISDSVIFAGHHDNVHQLLSALDCFLLTSLSEGLGCALMEAMAAGLLCIGSNVGGIPEVISDPASGFIIPPQDSDALAETMLKCIEMEPSARKQMCSAAQARIRDFFSDAGYAKHLINLYKQEIAASGVSS